MKAPDWETRFAGFLERVMATAASGGDPKPLQEEYAKMLAEAPAGALQKLKLKDPEKKDDKPKPPRTGKRPAAR